MDGEKHIPGGVVQRQPLSATQSERLLADRGHWCGACPQCIPMYSNDQGGVVWEGALCRQTDGKAYWSQGSMARCSNGYEMRCVGLGITRRNSMGHGHHGGSPWRQAARCCRIADDTGHGSGRRSRRAPRLALQYGLWRRRREGARARGVMGGKSKKEALQWTGQRLNGQQPGGRIRGRRAVGAQVRLRCASPSSPAACAHLRSRGEAAWRGSLGAGHAQANWTRRKTQRSHLRGSGGPDFGGLRVEWVVV